MAVAVPAPDPAADRAALLFERHYGAVFGYCSWRLRRRFDAEEAAQTTFARALAALRRGHRPRNERAWLVTIARNVCTTLGTAPHRTAEVVGDVPAGIAPAVDHGLAPELEAALAALPEGQRRALLLREWHELSYREIATELGVSVGTVESWIFRARRSLASTLGSARRQLGLAALLRWLGPSGGAKVVVATVVATGAVATERAVESHRGHEPAVARTVRAATSARTTPGATVVRAVRAARRDARARTAKSVDVRAPDTPAAPVAEKQIPHVGATRNAPASPLPPVAESAPAGGSPAPRPAPTPAPVQPPPAQPVAAPPAVETPALPVPDPSPPIVTVPSAPGLPVQPPALPVEPPKLPVDVPQLPPTSDLPVDVPKLP